MIVVRYLITHNYSPDNNGLLPEDCTVLYITWSPKRGCRQRRVVAKEGWSFETDSTEYAPKLKKSENST